MVRKETTGMLKFLHCDICGQSFYHTLIHKWQQRRPTFGQAQVLDVCQTAKCNKAAKERGYEERPKLARKKVDDTALHYLGIEPQPDDKGKPGAKKPKVEKGDGYSNG